MKEFLGITWISHIYVEQWNVEAKSSEAVAVDLQTTPKSDDLHASLTRQSKMSWGAKWLSSADQVWSLLSNSQGLKSST